MNTEATRATNDSAPTGSQRPSKVRVRRIRILYLDDEPGLTRLCKLFLEKDGYLRNDEVFLFAVDVSNDCYDALKKLKEHDYDVVLSNVIMPSLDGGEFAYEARVQGYKGPIGFVTAIIQKKSDDPEFINGFGFLAKPVSAEGLVRFILTLIELEVSKS